MKSTLTIEKKDTMLGITIFRLLRESLKMRRPLKKLNKLDEQKTKRP